MGVAHLRPISGSSPPSPITSARTPEEGSWGSDPCEQVLGSRHHKYAMCPAMTTQNISRPPRSLPSCTLLRFCTLGLPFSSAPPVPYLLRMRGAPTMHALRKTCAEMSASTTGLATSSAGARPLTAQLVPMSRSLRVYLPIAAIISPGCLASVGRALPRQYHNQVGKH